MTQARTHQPCPDCGSSDALTVYPDGGTYCFSCEKSTNPNKKKPKVNLDTITGEVKAVPLRKLDYTTCEQFGYQCGKHNGEAVQIAKYKDKDGNLKFIKVRTKDKGFRIIGDFEPILYGQHLWNGSNQKLIITEGEIDCLSVYQVNGGFPVVSVPNGAASAKKAIKAQLDWIEKFPEVIFMFDMDEPGRQAAKECAELISIGKAKIAELPLKDPNEMLQVGRTQELKDKIFRAAEFRPDGIINAADLWEEINKPIEYGFSYPFKTLTDITYGLRIPELIVFGAGTGMGKTTFFKEFEAHLLSLPEYKDNIGIIHLEETVNETVLGLMSVVDSKQYDKPDTEYTAEEKRLAFDTVTGSNRVHIYDAFGSTDLDTITSKIRYLVTAKDCKFIFLDHITALADGIVKAGEVNQAMRNIVSTLAKLTRELNFTLFTISHLRKSGDKACHEEGGRVHLDDLLGASCLKQWASLVVGLERNQQADDELIRHTTKLRILKTRYNGKAIGKTFKVRYMQETGRLLEVDDAEVVESFEDMDDEF